MDFKDQDEFYDFVNNYTYRRKKTNSSLVQVADDLESLEWVKDILYQLVWVLYKNKKLSKKDLDEIFNRLSDIGE